MIEHARDRMIKNILGLFAVAALGWMVAKYDTDFHQAIVFGIIGLANLLVVIHLDLIERE